MGCLVCVLIDILWSTLIVLKLKLNSKKATLYMYMDCTITDTLKALQWLRSLLATPSLRLSSIVQAALINECLIPSFSSTPVSTTIRKTQHQSCIIWLQVWLVMSSETHIFARKLFLWSNSWCANSSLIQNQSRPCWPAMYIHITTCLSTIISPPKVPLTKPASLTSTQSAPDNLCSSSHPQD